MAVGAAVNDLAAGEWTVRVRPMERSYPDGKWGYFDSDGEFVPGYPDAASRDRDYDDCRTVTGRIENGLCMSCGVPLVAASPGWNRCPTNPNLEQQLRTVNGRLVVVFRRRSAIIGA